MPTDHNPTAGFTPPAGAPADSHGEPLVPPSTPDPVTLSHVPTAEDATATVSPGGTAAVAPGSLPDIPGYAVEEEIARGGMGVVYRARHLRLNRPAAIKMILGGKYHDPTARVRFLIEAEAVAALDHPHVVHVHEFGTHDGLPFFALEFVGGGTLAERLKRDGKPAPRAAAELMVKLVDGIAAAHAKGIVHRDLKPANVLLASPGREPGESLLPKVADFGLAKVGQSDMTATGAVMGTPSYMSPEQAAGRTKEVGTHSDVYALGAILYELLTGRPPFLGESSMATIQQVLTRETERPRTIDAGIPRDLETIALKCLAKEPGKRYATASELAADLRSYLDGRPIAARPVGSLERAWKWVRRNRVVTGAAVVVVSALTAGTTASYLKYRDAEKQKQQAERDAAKAQKAREFLVSIFKKAETEVMGGNVTVRQLLAEAETTIPVEFAGQPELRAELLADIAGVKRGIARRTPQAMILDVRGTVQLQSAVGRTKEAGRHALVNLDDRLTLGVDGQVQLIFLSDFHKEWVQPGRTVTIDFRGCEPADAVRERDAGVLMPFVPLPKGTFYMGWGKDFAGRLMTAKKTEIPEDFEIAVHDVTQGQWEMIMGNNPSSFSRQGSDQGSVVEISDEELRLFPVEMVLWDEVQVFIKKLNEKERGRGWVYRLPTEAEWEYACRCGATSEDECSFRFYLDKPTNDLSSEYANFNGNYPVGKAPQGPFLRRPTRVGAYPPNKLGLCDMHGNVLQLCANLYSAGHSERVTRGSAWSSYGSDCQAAPRVASGRPDRFSFVGFRLARVPSAPGK